MSSTSRSRLKASITRARAFSPMASIFSGARISGSIAAASSSTSPIGARTPVVAVLDHQFRRAGAARHHGVARRHRLQHGQAEALDARGEDIDRNAPIPQRHFLDRQFAQETDPVREAGGGDFALEPVDESCVVRGDQADDDGGEIGISGQEPQHGGDEKVDALLLAHPAEYADPIFARQPGRGEGRRAILRRLVGFKVDAVMDHRRLALQKGSGDFAGGDDFVHPRDQETGEGGVAALAGGIENQGEAPAQPFQQQADHHFDIAAGVPDADLVAPGRAEAQAQKAQDRQPRDSLRRVGAEPDRVAFLAISGAMVRLTAVPPE